MFTGFMPFEARKPSDSVSCPSTCNAETKAWSSASYSSITTYTPVITLMMKAVRTSGTSVILYQATLYNIAEDGHLHIHVLAKHHITCDYSGTFHGEDNAKIGVRIRTDMTTSNIKKCNCKMLTMRHYIPYCCFSGLHLSLKILKTLPLHFWKMEAEPASET
jgi:hypothetical protein